MKKKITSLVVMSVMVVTSMPTVNVFANEVIKNKAVTIENEVSKSMAVTDLKINNNLKFNRSVIEQGQKESTQASIKQFKYLNNKDYIDQYRIPYSNIKKISNNAGQYMSQNIQKAADNDVSTYWETNKYNTDTWKNEVTVEFENPVTIDRLAYGARQSDRSGFIESFEVYSSDTDTGENFKLVATGKASTTTGLVEAKFKPTTFKRIKLKVIKSDKNWVTLNEIMFFKEDVISDKVEKLFTNGLMEELNPEFNSLATIEALEKEVKSHPLKETLMPQIELAKKILKGETNKDSSRTLVAEQRGNYSKEGSKRSISGNAFTSLEPFGKYVTPGEEIVVYVDADSHGAMPKLAFGQVGKDKGGGWRKLVSLNPGRNVIKAPTNMNCAGVYLVNDYYPEEQPYAPKVRFEGGTAYPIYIHGETDVKEFNKQLEEYASKVEYSDEAFTNGNPEGKVFNIAELVSENCVITTSAKGALEGVKIAQSKGYDVSDTMDSWEEMYDMFQSFMGFDENAIDEKDKPFPNKFIARVFQGVPLGFADHGYTGYLGSGNTARDGGFFKTIVTPIQMPGNDNWAYSHEFGHIFNTRYIVHGEVTNNLFAQEYRRLHPGIGGDRSNWNGILKRFKGEKFSLGYFESLAVLSQLNIAYGPDAYTKASKAVRDNKELISSIKGSDLQRLSVAYSLGLGVDLTDFFDGWGYAKATPQMKEIVANLPKPNKKIEYLHGGAYDYKGTGFSDDVKVEVSSSINKDEKTNTLSFDIDNSNRDDLLGYEILKDGKFIGYTKENKFVVKDIDINENAKYDVVAYAKDLSTAKPVSINAFQPRLEIVGGVTLEVSEKFNPLDYVKANDYEDNEIRDIKVTSNVDTNKKGNYKVTYEVDYKGVIVTKTMNVEVASKYDYLSDSEWKSASTEYGTPSRNNSIKGRTLGEIKSYDKGIRIHANGNVVYDLGYHDYDNFEVKVGVDMNIPAQNKSSISFKIIGDGKTLATTKVIKHEDNMQYIKVPIRGIKELRLEVNNGGDNNESDHSVFVEPKLITNNDNRVDTKELIKAIEEAKKINKDIYTEESIKVLNEKLAKAESLLKEEKTSQEDIDAATTELRNSIKSLVEISNDKFVNIPDKYLVKSLSSALNKDGNFTVEDMCKLTDLNISYGVVSLEGLQHAKNLESISGENNEVKDLRPLAKLEKLKKVDFKNQYVQAGSLTPVDGKMKVITEAYNRSSKNIVTKVAIVNQKGEVIKEQTLDGKNKDITIDVSDMEPGSYGVHVYYEDSEINGILMYMTEIK